MPANAPYPGESPQAFLARMQAQSQAGAGNINVPQLPGARPMAAPAGAGPQMPAVPPAGGAMGGMGPPGVMGGQPKLPDSTLPPEVTAGVTMGGQQGNRLNIPDAALGAMLGTYGDQMELGEMDRQMAQAEALRNQAGPEGRSAGRVYVAANPLEHIGTGIQRYRAGRDAERLEEGTLKGAKGGKLTEDERATLAAMGEFSGEELGRKGLRKRIGGQVREYGKRVLSED